MESLRALCRRRIAALCASEDVPAQFEEHVIAWVEGNLTRRRFQLSDSDPTASLSGYIDRVISTSLHEWTRVHALDQGDPVEWAQLSDLLRRRAYSMIKHYREADAYEMAHDFAQQACLAIFSHPFPWDVSFDAWTTRILKNQVMAHYTRSSDALDQPIPTLSIDEPSGPEEDGGSPLAETIVAPSSRAPFEKIENLDFLLEALAQVRSATQYHVIVWTYFDQVEDEEIARRLKMRIQNIYNLRRRGLIRLYQILTKQSERKRSKKS
jgi:RNA polymerase sigma factor (sigma-70 family)